MAHSNYRKSVPWLRSEIEKRSKREVQCNLCCLVNINFIMYVLEKYECGKFDSSSGGHTRRWMKKHLPVYLMDFPARRIWPEGLAYP